MPPPPQGSFQIDFHGFDLIRSRDCIVWVRDDNFPVRVDAAMVAGGWPGGQGVQWVDGPADEFLVTYSSGEFGGFLVWGSDEAADQHTAMTRSGVAYGGDALLFGGSALLSTSSYERYTYNSRLGGPLVDLVYGPNDPLYFSLRGLWTKEDELSLSGAPLPARGVGRVMQVPQPVNQFFLGIQATI